MKSYRFKKLNGEICAYTMLAKAEIKRSCGHEEIHYIRSPFDDEIKDKIKILKSKQKYPCEECKNKAK